MIAVLSKVPNLTKELCVALPQLKFYDVSGSVLDECTKSDIIVADFDLIAPYVYKLPNTKWIQGTWAGVDKLLPHIQENRPLPCLLTRFSGTHFGKIMSEYVIANVVNYERNFYQNFSNQNAATWCQSGKTSDYRIISDLTIAILGVGNIGNYIGKMLHCFGAKVLGFGRSKEISPKFERNHIAHYYTFENLSELLKTSDYIVNALPNTPETKGLLNNNVLNNCKKSVFINIGRGNIIDDAELIHALNEKWLSGAILDVFNAEPLPRESPLWKMENVIITPHVAGTSRAKDIAEQFKINYELYLKNQPIPTTLEMGNTY